MPLDPAIAALMSNLGVDGPPPTTPPTVEQMRQGNRQLSLAVAPQPPLEVASVRDETIAGVPVRIYRPAGDQPKPTVVFFHGGGFIVGDLDTHDGPCRRLSRDVDAIVVSVEYRLAPEFPYPAGYQDCLAVVEAVSDDLQRYGGAALAVAGDSAGANLAAGVAQAFRDQGRSLAAQLLAYPATDLSGKTEYPSFIENATGYVLSSAEVDHDMEMYFANDPEAAQHAPASPLLAESLSGVAPAVIACGEFDPLRDQGLAYADKLIAAGIEVKKHFCPGLIHGFLNFDTVSTSVDETVGTLYAEFKELIQQA